MKKTGLTLSVMLCCSGLYAQCYWQQQADYVMDIDFDVETHQMSGKQTLTYTNNSPDTLRRVFYHLYFNAFQPNSAMDNRSRWIADPDGRVMDRISLLTNEETGRHIIESLSQNGVPLKYHTEGTVLEVTLDKPVLPHSSTSFQMSFRSQVPVQIRRSGRNNSEGISYSMAQWFPKIAEYDKKGWHAHPYIAREFYAPWGDYQVNITIDRRYMVAATGILQNPQAIGFGYEKTGTRVERQAGNTLTWKFKAERVHDFVWAADPDYVHTTAKVPEGPTIHFFYQKDSLTANWEELPAYTVKAFEFIQKHFGRYPYSQYSVIQGGDGGMEYPMATLITGHRQLRSLVGVTVHEILHTWYQMLLATNESYYAWMDEGFTSYATSLTMNHLFGGDVSLALDNNYSGYFNLAASGREEPLSTHADHFQTNMAYGLGSYQKGAVSLAQLGYIIGEDNRDKGLLRYFNEWKFKHPDLNDFVRVMEKTSGMELDWYYEYWINSTHTIDYALTDVEQEGRETLVKITRVGVMPMPLDVQVVLQSGEIKNYYIPLDIMRGEKPTEPGQKRTTLPDWQWTDTTYTFNIDEPLRKIASVTIDPSGKMADVNPDNNAWMP